MLCASDLDMPETVTQELIDDFCEMLPGMFAQPITWYAWHSGIWARHDV